MCCLVEVSGLPGDALIERYSNPGLILNPIEERVSSGKETKDHAKIALPASAVYVADESMSVGV